MTRYQDTVRTLMSNRIKELLRDVEKAEKWARETYPNTPARFEAMHQLSVERAKLTEARRMYRYLDAVDKTGVVLAP